MRLTASQRQELVESYLELGYRATIPLAIAAGVKPRHLAKLARNAGLLRNYADKGPADRAPKRDPQENKNSLANLALGRGGQRWRGKLPVPPHAHPLVRQLFGALNEQKTTLTEISERASIRRGTMSNWRYRHIPQIDLFEAALNVLDLELVIRKKGERRGRPPAELRA